MRGGFCKMATGEADWPAWRKNPSFFRWSWPGGGARVLGVNGQVTTPSHPAFHRPEDDDLPMGAMAYKVLLPLRKW